MKYILDRINNLIKSHKGFTQKGMSEAIGVSASTLNNWLKLGRDIPADKIIPISEYLDISPEYLLTGKESGQSKTQGMDPDYERLYSYFEQLPERQKGELIGYAKRMAEENRKPVENPAPPEDMAGTA